MRRSDFEREILIITEEEGRRLDELESHGVQTIRPVALPRGAHLAGDNRHLGWPVGIKVGSALLCAYHRSVRHHGKVKGANEHSSSAMVVRSTDGGRLWSDPLDLRQFGTNDKETVLNFGNCFGVLGDSVFFATRYGLYRSDDEGLTWTFLKGALTQEQTGHAYKDNFGPRMVVHPEKGLMIPVGVAGEPFLDIYCSVDQGRTWTHERFPVTADIHPLEPTALYRDGRLIFVSRNHPLPFRYHQSIQGNQRPVQMVSNTGWFPMDHAGVTNISSYRWPDTTDIDYNPVTDRFDAVVANRSGGVLENEQNEQSEQTVNLWSIAKEDMYAGQVDRWRFEATLLRLTSGMLEIEPHNIDAAHPGGAVMDVENGLQHVFIYCGRYETPTGVYVISRDLNTANLA